MFTVQAVNSAFVKLRKAVPLDNKRGKRVSKVGKVQFVFVSLQHCTMVFSVTIVANIFSAFNPAKPGVLLFVKTKLID